MWPGKNSLENEMSISMWIFLFLHDGHNAVQVIRNWKINISF